MFQEHQISQLKDLLSLSDPIVISFDMGWHKRYGFNSDLGRFCVYNFNLDEIIYGGVKNKGRLMELNGKVHEVAQSNYDGSSKGMEASALEDFLNWSSEKLLLPKISIVCCDKDSSVHKLLSEDPRCKHIELLYDPGHMKKSFQGSLMKIFGQSKATESFASRMASWMMRSLSEAKAKHGADREAMKIEFIGLMNEMVPHYTRARCPVNCPCYGIPYCSVPLSARDATEFSPLDSPKDVIFTSILRHLDPETLASASLVCNHFYAMAQNVQAEKERRKDKIILPLDSPYLPAVEDLVAKLLKETNVLCHQYHTCLVESSHNQCLAFGEKRVQYFKSFEGRTFASYCKFNLGWMWVAKLYEKLGIPVSDNLKHYLVKKDAKSNYHRDRQRSVKYKLRAKVLSVKKKKDRKSREKKSRKLGHDYLESKELYPSEKKKKGKVVSSFEMEDRVFGLFGTIHYFGVVLHADPAYYMVKFIDGEVRDLEFKDLVNVNRMRGDKRCWVPKWIKATSISYDEFDEYYEKFDRQLECDFEKYSDGLLFSQSDSDDSDSDSVSDSDDEFKL